MRRQRFGPDGVEVAVLGSANRDLVLPVAALPMRGETVLAAEAVHHAGGKGLNQAVAAARAGARTAFVGAIGDDEPGAELTALLRDEAIDARRLRVTDSPTGLAVVLVDRTGENCIAVAPGANATVLELGEADLALLTKARVLLAQLEIPLATVTSAARAARRAGATVGLTAAPAQRLPKQLLAAVDLLVVNEHEARTLADLGTHPGASAALHTVMDVLLESVAGVVVTQGAAGVLYRSRSGSSLQVPALRADAVDTTGAGDAFTGALAAVLADDADLVTAIRFAVAAAALSVEHPGAVPSIPRREQIEARLRRADAAGEWARP